MPAESRDQVSQELGNLDCLRSFAVIAVLIDHWSVMHNSRLGGRCEDAFGVNLGFVGVVAFFVHTSLVLMFSLKRMNVSRGLVPLRFYIRRIFRIYPLSILTILFVLLFRIPEVPVLGSHFVMPTLKVAFANLLLIQNLVGHTSVLGPLWSLPFEIEMYAVLPALFLIATKRRGAESIAALFLWFTAFSYAIRTNTGLANLLAYVPCFLSGVFAFTLRGKVRPTIPASLWPLTLCVWFALCSRLISGYATPADLVMQAVMCFALGSSLNFFHDLQSSFLNLATGTIAKYSFGIYLTHFPAMWIVQGFWKSHELLATALWLVLTALASAVLYHFLEAPMIDFGKSIADGLFVATTRAPKVAEEAEVPS
jgi:peptidoglycan/LPS O-acetylase OafA/YrhL